MNLSIVTTFLVPAQTFDWENALIYYSILHLYKNERIMLGAASMFDKVNTKCIERTTPSIVNMDNQYMISRKIALSDSME